MFSRNPELVKNGYTEDSAWRNRDKFFAGRDALVEFLTDKWSVENGYRLRKELFAFNENKFSYEWHDTSGRWYRCYGLEDWTFAPNGLMSKRRMSGNDVKISDEERWFEDDVVWALEIASCDHCRGHPRQNSYEHPTLTKIIGEGFSRLLFQQITETDYTFTNISSLAYTQTCCERPGSVGRVVIEYSAAYKILLDHPAHGRIKVSNMTALRVLLSSLVSEPLGLKVVDYIGMAVGLDLKLNFEPALSIKEPAVPNWGGIDMAEFNPIVPYSNAALNVVLHAAASVVEPYLPSIGDEPVNIGPCGFSDASSSSLLPFAGRRGGMGKLRCALYLVLGGEGNFPQHSTNARCACSVSGDGQHDGDDGRNNGNGNAYIRTPPTSSVQGVPDATLPPKPMEGSTPPPPPPPEPGTGGSSDDNKDDNNSRLFQILFILFIAIFLSSPLALFHKSLWYRLVSNISATRSAFTAWMGRSTKLVPLVFAATYNTILEAFSVRGVRTASMVHEDVSMLVPLLVEEDDIGMANVDVTTDLIIWNPRIHELVVVANQPICNGPEYPVVDEQVFVQQSLVDEPAVGTNGTVVIIESSTQISLFSRFFNFLFGFFVSAPKILLVTVVGLFVFTNVLIQAAGLDAQMVFDVLKAQWDVGLVGVYGSLVWKEGDIVKLGNSSITPLDEIPSSIAPYSSVYPVFAEVQHIGGTPLTEMVVPEGGRKRRIRKRKKEPKPT